MRKGNGLTAVLVGCDLRYNLRCNVAGCAEAVGTLYKSACDDRTVLQHILKIDEVAVMHMLSEVVGIMEMDYALVMRVNNILRQKETVCYIAGYLTRHIVALRGVDHGVFIGVLLLCLFVVALDKAEYLIIGGVGLTHKRSDIAVCDIALCHLIRAVCHYLLFHQVLHFLDAGRTPKLLAGKNDVFGNTLYLHGCHTNAFVNRFVSFTYGNYDF